MLELDNQTDPPHDPEQMVQMAQALSDRPVEVVLVDDECIATLNRTHRQKEGPTDVLSFRPEPVVGAPLGSVVISVQRAQHQAQAYGHTPQEEIDLLFLHGLLHLLGYDHECDTGQMAEKEQQLRQRFNLPASLTERS